MSEGTWNESEDPYHEHSEVGPEAEVGVDVPEGLARARVQEVQNVVCGMTCYAVKIIM